MRKRLLDCELAITPWGEKARFSQAKIGLIRKNSIVHLLTISSNNNNQKFPINSNSIELLPAAIKLITLKKYLFIRRPSDEQKYSTMIREINVILKETKLRQNGKAEALDKLISSIPLFSELDPRDLRGPAALATRLIYDTTNGDYIINQAATDSVAFICNDGGCNNKLNNNDDEDGGGDDRKTITSLSNHQTRTTETTKTTTTLTRHFPTLVNKRLKSIKISGLDKLPRSLWCRSSLKELILSNCNLEFVPKQLEKFATSLTILDLSQNRIATLPRTFCCKMSKLICLNLSHNQIEKLPLEIKFLRKLVNLDLSYNNLMMLPSTFSDLRRLSALNLANNSLKQIPAFRREELKLNELDVSFNPLDGASNDEYIYEVYPSIHDCSPNYKENPLMDSSPITKTKFPTLFEISMLNIVRHDRLFRLASEESLPKTIVSTMQRDIFKCYKCSRMSILPAYSSTDSLDYVNQVGNLISTGNRTTFMKLLCRSCFDR